MVSDRVWLDICGFIHFKGVQWCSGLGFVQASQVLQYLFILTEIIGIGIAKPVILKRVSTYFWKYAASERTECVFTVMLLKIYLILIIVYLISIFYVVNPLKLTETELKKYGR